MARETDFVVTYLGSKPREMRDSANICRRTSSRILQAYTREIQKKMKGYKKIPSLVKTRINHKGNDDARGENPDLTQKYENLRSTTAQSTDQIDQQHVPYKRIQICIDGP